MRFLCQVYEDWQSNPTVTYLKNTGLPLSDIDFPSLTICAQGSIYQVAIFLKWSNGNKDIQISHIKVTNNVINHQVNNYIESKGKNPHTMSEAEKDKHKSEMFEDLYPGRELFNNFSNMQTWSSQLLHVPLFKVWMAAILMSYQEQWPQV